MTSSNLKRRVITALILAAVVIAIEVWSAFSLTGQTVLSLIGILAVAIAAYEYATFSSESVAGISKLLRSIYITAALLSPALWLFAVSHLDGSGQTFNPSNLAHSLIAGGAATFAFILLLVFVEGRDSMDSARRVCEGLPLAGILIGGGGGLLVALSEAQHPAFKLFWLIPVVAAVDIGAYFLGSYLKGPKLAPAISPGKTWSGGFGGLLSALIIGVILGFIFQLPLSFARLSLASIAVGVLSQLGDLSKSYLKRLHGVKDSGTILPGHGGVLDRIDGLLGAAAVAWLMG